MTKKIICISDIHISNFDTPKKRYKLEDRWRRILKKAKSIKITGDIFYD